MIPGLMIRLTSAIDDDVRTLVGALEAELAAGYTPEQRHGLALEAIFQPHIKFFLAYHGGDAIGCGGVAFFEGFAEVKRMFVRPGWRGKGAARALLQRIETATRDHGLTVLRLETGNAQHAAMRFYQCSFFQPCGVFGDYAKLPASAIATSLFFEKTLA